MGFCAAAAFRGLGLGTGEDPLGFVPFLVELTVRLLEAEGKEFVVESEEVMVAEQNVEELEGGLYDLLFRGKVKEEEDVWFVSVASWSVPTTCAPVEASPTPCPW